MAATPKLSMATIGRPPSRRTEATDDHYYHIKVQFAETGDPKSKKARISLYTPSEVSKMMINDGGEGGDGTEKETAQLPDDDEAAAVKEDIGDDDEEEDTEEEVEGVPKESQMSRCREGGDYDGP